MMQTNNIYTSDKQREILMSDYLRINKRLVDLTIFKYNKGKELIKVVTSEKGFIRVADFNIFDIKNNDIVIFSELIPTQQNLLRPYAYNRAKVIITDNTILLRELPKDNPYKKGTTCYNDVEEDNKNNDDIDLAKNPYIIVIGKEVIN